MFRYRSALEIIYKRFFFPEVEGANSTQVACTAAIGCKGSMTSMPPFQPDGGSQGIYLGFQTCGGTYVGRVRFRKPECSLSIHCSNTELLHKIYFIKI